MKRVYCFVAIIIFLLNAIIPSKFMNPTIPVTGLVHEIDRSRLFSLKNISLSAFVADVYSGNPNEITGLYAMSALKYPVRHQPIGQPGFVSTTPGVVTQFEMASQFGSIGIIAHNYLSGKTFFSYQVNQELVVIYGNGNLKRFTITDIREYQALSPTSPYSSFVDLSRPGVQISAEDLFYDTYGINDRLVLQTCIEKNNVDSWGRLFIIAEPTQLTQIIQPTELDLPPKSNGVYWIYKASM